VFLARQSWSCPWPSEAESLPVDEETVVIRVVVRPDGTAESVAIVSDPGHGFGQAAASCAMRTPFVPAHAAGGAPIRATSAPIRVRFTRR
jgi:protein TonB